ncbi:MAG: hypothetical protein CL770_00565, partial [Chloroflexi bacterium]|nr:hypothetical protein [Chloroflexota bacterium]
MLLASTALAKSDLAYAAVAGTVTLTGGEAGTHYSDKQTFNIVTIAVADADVSAERSGVARFITPDVTANNKDGCQNYPLNGTAIPTTCGSANNDTTPAILAGEVEKTDTFTATNNQTVFVLTSPGRDADDNAGLTISDVVVTVDGTVTAAASVQTTKSDGSASGNNGASLA